MDTENKTTETGYLTQEAVEIFMKANILHSIDRGLLKVKWKDVDVKLLSGEQYMYVDLIVNKVGNRDGFVTRFEFRNLSDPDKAMRAMVGVAMQVLDTLNHYDHKEKTPIIKVVK